jgi:Flp pilus assembly protein TadG
VIARLGSDRRGASAVEFALVMPVFAILMFGAMAFGQAFYALGSVQWAVERTARELMIDGAISEAEFEARVRTIAARMTAMEYDVAYSETVYGDMRVTEIRTTLRYPVRIPFMEPVWLSYPVETHAPRPL